jgi:hypothetical protein
LGLAVDRRDHGAPLIAVSAHLQLWGWAAAIQRTAVASRAVITSESLRPVLAGTWKAWVRVSDEVEPRPTGQIRHRLLEQIELRQRVLGSLQEEHRHGDVRKMPRARERWLARRMQRKGKKDQANDGRERLST